MSNNRLKDISTKICKQKRDPRLEKNIQIMDKEDTREMRGKNPN